MTREERNEATNMTRQILWSLPKHDIIASPQKQFSFSIKSKVAKQVAHHTRPDGYIRSDLGQEICFHTCCGSCYGDFPSEIPAFPHRTPLPAIASDWAEGNLARTVTAASDWHHLSHLSTKGNNDYYSRPTDFNAPECASFHSPSSSGRLDRELQSERMSSSGERKKNNSRFTEKTAKL